MIEAPMHFRHGVPQILDHPIKQLGFLKQQFA